MKNKYRSSPAVLATMMFLVNIGLAAPVWAEPADFVISSTFQQELKVELKSKVKSLYSNVENAVTNAVVRQSGLEGALPGFITRIADVFFNGNSVENSIDVATEAGKINL